MMMGNYNWQQDIEVEVKRKQAYNEVCRVLLNSSVLTYNEDKDYDCILDNNKKIEIKVDDKSIKTGRVAIEYSSKSGSSGIDATVADYWLHLYLDNQFESTKQYNIILIPTIELKALTRCGKYERRHIANAGMVVIPVTVFEPWLVGNIKVLGNRLLSITPTNNIGVRYTTVDNIYF